MTPDMSFECLLVTQDAAVVSTMNRLLTEFSISTNVCGHPAEAASLLSGKSVDLLVLDFQDDDHCKDLLKKVASSVIARKTTVLALSHEDRFIHHVDLVVQKPLWADSAARNLRLAYTKMMQDHRQRGRVSLMKSIIATDRDEKPVALTVTDIGYNGAGFRTRQPLAVDDLLTLNLPLPGIHELLEVKIRVLWTRDYGAAGGEFVHLSPATAAILHEWVRRASAVKEPLTHR